MTVFVSHSRRDSESPEFSLLLNDLDLMRRQVWLDSERLMGGQAWWEEILEQIRGCELFLTVLTKKSLNSEACRRELSYAAALQRTILPVRLVDLPNWELPDSLTSAHILDYSKRAGSDNGVTCAFALRDAVDGLTSNGGRALPDPLPPPPDIPPSYLAELQPLLQAKELPLAKQEQFVQDVRAHLDDEDEDRKSLAEVLQRFRTRHDIAYKVALEVDELLTKLTTGRPSRRPIADAGDVEQAAQSPNSGPLDHEPAADQASVNGGLGPRRGQLEFSTENSKISRFKAPGVDVAQLAQSLRGWYESQHLETQLVIDGARVVVQCRSTTWARRLGAGAALTAILSTDGEELAVEIGGGRWGDKVAAIGVGWFIAWPALIPAAMGGYKQATLPSKTLHYLQSMIPLCSERA
jgi:TIR domain